MAGRRSVAVRVTRNFERTLEGIGAFLRAQGTEGGMETLRAELRERLVPTLETFPKACRKLPRSGAENGSSSDSNPTRAARQAPELTRGG